MPGPGCLANGSLGVAQAIEQAIRRRKLDVKLNLGLKTTGCHGFCERGPLVVIQPKGIFYQGVKPDDVKEIVEKTLVEGEVIQRLLYRDPNTKQRVEQYTAIPFYCQAAAHRPAEHWPNRPGRHRGLPGRRRLCRPGPGPDQDEAGRGHRGGVQASGLRGRGGGGFPTGRKWKTCRNAHRRRAQATCSATQTRATLARLWTAASAKVIRTPCWRAW